MSSVKLTLRQPPNVDFVHGFPGIPAGANRQHASVKGLVELRVGAGHPVKAKYIKVELRKIEILPGGGPSSNFADVVGTGSFNVWTAKDEWEVINTQDIPFNIRIPENVPPSVALENGGGIRYELAAEICIKTKKGLFRKDVSPIRGTTAPIVIDKHELHSTWPVYLKPDVREVEKDGFTLVVERTNTCYGPGDRVAVKASINSASGTGAVRSYEMALRETAVFRRGPNSGTKANAGPTVRSNFIGSEKLPVRVVIRPGLSDSVELKCTIPASHTTTTVVTAQHIEIVYSLAVRAILDGGTELVIDNIPVMMSNWPRNVSEATVQKIGYAPHLSLDQEPPAPSPEPAAGRPLSMASGTPPPGRQPRQQRPYSIVEKVGGSNGPRPDIASTLPANAKFGGGGADEFGAFGSNGYPNQKVGLRPGTAGSYMGTPLIPEESEPASSITGSLQPTGNMSDLSSSNKPARPLTRYNVVNGDDSAERPYPSALEEKNRLKQTMADEETPSAGGSGAQAPVPSQNGGGRPVKGWLTAEQEKQKQQEQSRRYQQAKKVAEDVQSAAVASLQATPSSDPRLSPQIAPASVSPPPPAVVPPQQQPVPVIATASPSWLTAEEEKHRRLFDEAQERAKRAQAAAMLSNSSPPPVNVIQNNSYQPPKSHVSPPPVTPSFQQPALAPSPAPVPAAAPAQMNVIRQDPSRLAAQQQQSGGYKASAGASLYQSAMMALGSSAAPTTPQATPARPQQNTLAPSPSPPITSGPSDSTSTPTRLYSPPATSSTYPSTAGGSAPTAAPPASGQVHLSAEAEKAQMRYLEAKRAVEHRQRNASTASNNPSPASNEPLPYDMLFPSGSPSATTATLQRAENRVSTPPVSQSPVSLAQSLASPTTPPPSASHTRAMSVSRQMNPLEAIASLRNNIEGGRAPAPPPRRQTPGIMSPSSPPPGQGSSIRSPLAAGSGLPPVYGEPPASPPQPTVYNSYQPPRGLTAEQEKAQLAARYRGVDNDNAGGSGSSSSQAPPAPSALAAPPAMAPGYSESSRPLDAVEEKARLAAAYAAEDHAANSANQSSGYGPPPTGSMSPPPAPPQVFNSQSPTWQPPPPHLQSPPPPATPGYAQQQQFAQASYNQPQMMYGTHSAMASPTPPSAQQMYSSTPPPSVPFQTDSSAQDLAAPIATRPLMPPNFESQRSITSTAYGMEQNPGAVYQPPREYHQTPAHMDQVHSGYYVESPDAMANGNGYGNGNGNGDGYDSFANNNSYAYNDEAQPGLRRDPSISQGKRRVPVNEQIAGVPPPPPLAPRPPAEYIQETERMAAADPSLNWGHQSHQSPGSPGSFGLEVRPFSPLDLSFDQQNIPFERPPLPPKVPI